MSEYSVTKSSDEAERDERLEAVIAEYIRDCDAGRVPDRRVILDRHPDLASELSEFIAQRSRLNAHRCW